MNRISYLFELRPNYCNKQGLYVVRLRVTIARKNKYYTLKIFIDLHQWDDKKQSCIGYDQATVRNNLIISRMKIAADQAIFNCNIRNTPITFDYFEKEVFGELFNKNDFIEYSKNSLKANGHKLSSETVRTYQALITKLEKFTPSLLFASINRDFINRYERYMIMDLNNSTNTVHRTFKHMKNICNQAIKDGLISDNPLSEVKIKLTRPDRSYLNINEVKAIWSYYNSIKNENTKLSNVCRYFLFSCFTGLRYGDIKQLKKEHIINSSIYLKMHKTDLPVMIPLSKQAIELIENNQDTIFLFRVLSNQKTNEYLKQICNKIDLNKQISFHCARHTFATMALSLQVPIEVISKLLGHTEIKTTQIYTRVLEDNKKLAIEKFSAVGFN